MIKGVITSENRESDIFEFTGTAAIAIWGDGDATILRSVSGSPFLPLTDSSGSPAEFINYEVDTVLLNTDISNDKKGVKFKIVGQTSSEINYVVNWSW